jgi:hypothetical protein
MQKTHHREHGEHREFKRDQRTSEENSAPLLFCSSVYAVLSVVIFLFA